MITPQPLSLLELQTHLEQQGYAVSKSNLPEKSNSLIILMSSNLKIHITKHKKQDILIHGQFFYNEKPVSRTNLPIEIFKQSCIKLTPATVQEIIDFLKIQAPCFIELAQKVSTIQKKRQIGKLFKIKL